LRGVVTAGALVARGGLAVKTLTRMLRCLTGKIRHPPFPNGEPSEELKMGRNLLAPAGAVWTAATIAFLSPSAAQTPKMGGGYKDVIAIPVDDPQTKSIAGALFKPAGAGPFPAVIYMGTCAGANSGEERFMQTTLRDRLLSKGFATLIVDPYWPRQEWGGVCDKAKAGGDYDVRGAKDIYAAAEVLRAMPEIDANRIFVQGYSLGASAALSAIDARNAPAHKAKLAGAIAFSPFCRQDAALSVPALIMVGDKDLWTSAARCLALKHPPNVQVVVYPGVGHGFAMPFGHHVQYDQNAAGDAKGRAEAFLEAHIIR
jgi:dienelactone hydrolase